MVEIVIKGKGSPYGRRRYGRLAAVRYAPGDPVAYVQVGKEWLKVDREYVGLLRCLPIARRGKYFFISWYGANQTRMNIRLHRFLIPLFFSREGYGNSVVDHINGDVADIRLSNLRLTTSGINTCSFNGRGIPKSGAHGVVKRKTGYQVRMSHENRHILIGKIPTLDLAARIYNAFSVLIRGKSGMQTPLEKGVIGCPEDES